MAEPSMPRRPAAADPSADHAARSPGAPTGTPTPAAGETRALLQAIRRLARAVDVQSRRIDRDLGLTVPQHIVLSVVHDLGNGTSRAIARDAALSPATVVGILDKLEAKGLIERSRSTTDRRSVHTRLTARGRATLARVPTPLGAGFEAAFAALSPATRARMIAALHDLADLAAPDEAALEETTDGL